MHVARFHTFLSVWHICKMPRKFQTENKPKWHLHAMPSLAIAVAGDIKGVAAVSSVCMVCTLRVISWWLFWLQNFQLLREQWWLWHSSLEVIKLSAHLCRNFHNIFKGHRMLLIFVPLHFCLLRDLLSSWTLLKQVLKKNLLEKGNIKKMSY